MDRSRSRDLALRGSRDLYYGSPASHGSTPVINCRPVLLMITYHNLRYMAQERTGSSAMIDTRSDLLTFSKLVAPPKLLRTLFSNVLQDLFDHISVVWDVYLDPDDLCIPFYA